MRGERVQFQQRFRIKHGYAFKGEFFDSEGPYALVTPGNFYEEGGFRHLGEKQKHYNAHDVDGFVLSEGDLIVAMTEQAEGLLGSCAIVPQSGRYLHNQRIGLVVDLDEKRLDRRYLYYLFNTPLVRHQIRATATGTKVRHTAPERIGRVQVIAPSPTAQRRVADTLSAYDELIDNNRRRMALLEDASRLLFREWFVRFRFPGHELVRVSKGVPQGWGAKVLGDLCREIRNQVRPEELDGDTPYIGLEHIPRRSITLCSWGRASEVTSTKHRFQAGDIIFGKIRPYFHKVGVTLLDGVASSDAIVLRPVSDELHAFVLLLVSSDEFVAVASKTAREGSKMPRADWNLMEKHPTALPPHRLLGSFSELVAPILKQLRALALQNRKLRAERDLLLPRLMSGEIEV